MTETIRRTGPDCKVPGQNPQEIPVAKSYVGNLVRDYIYYQERSSVLAELLRNGLPNDAKTKQPEVEANLKQDLRNVLFSLLETYDFWGEIPTKRPTGDRSSALQPYFRHQGLPHLDLITLQHTLPNVKNPTVRFKKNEDGSIVVKGTDFRDFGERGFPPGFWMASEYLIIDFDGRVKLAAKYFPGKDPNGIERRYFKDRPLFPNSLLVLKSLVAIALNGAKLQENGQLFYANGTTPSNGRLRPKNRLKIFT